MQRDNARQAPQDTTEGPRVAASPWNRRRLLRGAQLFVGLTLAAILVLFARGKLVGTAEELAHLSGWALAVGALQSIFDVLGGGVRIWLLSRAFGYPIGLGTALVANGGNVFLGGITPSQTGGGLAQLYVMKRAGMPVSAALVASLVAFLGTVLVLLAAGLMVVLVRAVKLPTGLQLFSWATVALFLAIVGLFALSLPAPEVYRGGLRRLFGRLPLVGARLQAWRRVGDLERMLEDFASRIRQAGRRHKLEIAGGFLISALIYGNKFLVAWVVLAGLGLAPPLRDVLYLQELQYLVMYFAPTPGASGLAELSAAEIMKPLVPSHSLGAFVLVWRTFSLFLPMLLGGALLVRHFLSRARPGADANG